MYFCHAFLVCVQDDLCSFSSFKLFFSTHAWKQLKISQTKIDHPSFPLNTILDPASIVGPANSTEQTWACWGVPDSHAGGGGGPHQKIRTQTEAPAVPRASRTACTLQFHCVGPPADFHCADIIPQQTTALVLRPVPNSQQHTARPAEPSGRKLWPGVTLPARSPCTKPGWLLSPSPLRELRPVCASPHPVEERVQRPGVAASKKRQEQRRKKDSATDHNFNFRPELAQSPGTWRSKSTKKLLFSNYLQLETIKL